MPTKGASITFVASRQRGLSDQTMRNGMSGFDFARLKAQLGHYETRAWPLAKLMALVDGREEGVSYRIVAKRLRVSTNAAIGQGHRLGLPQRGPTPPAAPKKSAAKPRAVKAEPLPPKPSKMELRHLDRAEIAAAMNLPPMAGRMITDLASTQCKWPVGDPKASDFAFCGRLKSEGAYCAAHAAVAVNAEATAKARRSDRRLQRDLEAGRMGAGRAA